MIEIGHVVKSIAGHDAGIFMVVIELEQGFVRVCDGKTRTLGSSKCKNIKHIAKTNTVLSPEAFKTDKQIRKALHRFNFGSDQT